MAKRHTMRPGDWETIFGRLEELVLANSGEDAFEEIFKLLIAKLWSEMTPERGINFAATTSAAETAANFNALLAEAVKRWTGIIQGPPICKLADEHLRVCIAAIASHSLLDANIEAMDGLFEYLMSKEAKGAKGQFFTPRHVIDCCVQIADPQPDEFVMDPACGSAGFLIHTLNHVRSSYPAFNTESYCQQNLWGCDFDFRTIRIAKTLMLMAGNGCANLYRLNSLLTHRTNVGMFPLFPSDGEGPRVTIEDLIRTRMRNFAGFDLILTNPPFAGDVRESALLKSYDVYRQGRKIERDVLFLERCVQLLRPGGRLAIVLPHNKFGSPSWSYLREWVMRQVRVIAVLGLGRHTFLPHTHQKASILFAIKRERPRTPPPGEEILFLISEKDGKDSSGRLVSRLGSRADDPAWLRADHDLEQIVATFRDFVHAAGIPWRI